MIPAQCRVSHNPERGTYGDCVRACIASMLDIADPDTVPHFYHDGCDGTVGLRRINEYLKPLGLVHFSVNYDGDLAHTDIMALIDPAVIYMLYGSDGEGDHVVICRGGKVIHNPAWFPRPMAGPGSHGYWTVAVLARI